MGAARPGTAAMVVAVTRQAACPGACVLDSSPCLPARHRIQRRYQHHAIESVGAACRNAGQRAAGAGDEVTFRWGLWRSPFDRPTSAGLFLPKQPSSEGT